MNLFARMDIPDVIVVYQDRSVTGGTGSNASLGGGIQQSKIGGSVTTQGTGGTINTQPTIDGEVTQ